MPVFFWGLIIDNGGLNSSEQVVCSILQQSIVLEE